MPSHLLVPTLEAEEKNSNIYQYVQKLDNNLQTAHQWAREHLHRGQRHQQKQYKKAQAKKMEIGTLVWLFNSTKKIGRSPKQEIKWEEKPCRVLGTLSYLMIKK